MTSVHNNSTAHTHSAEPKQLFKVLYVGPKPEMMKNVLSRVDLLVGLHAVSGVADAMAMVRRQVVDCVVVDQCCESNQAALLTAAMAGEPNVKRIVVITSPEHASSYEMLGPKCEVLFAPARPMVLLDAVFARKNKSVKRKSWKSRLSRSKSFFSNWKMPKYNFSRAVIPVVSFIYKNTALVLLTALFSVFLSYGVLIVFFLISNDWSAPLTLSKGNDLVTKTERQIGDMRVKENHIKQRISKEQRESLQAERAVGDAKVLASLVAATVDGEIEQRLVLQKDLKTQLKRLKVLRIELKRALSASGAQQALQDKFKKRLINRKIYDSSMLALLELRQRSNGVEADFARLRRDISKTRQSILMLETMRKQIQEPGLIKIKSASSEFVSLANQVVSVKTALENAQSQLNSHFERLALLRKNEAIVEQGLAEIMATPLARAIKAPVVVLFVPYTNAKNFKPNEPLFACSIGVFWCKKVGYTGKTIAGEAVSVHPFFGKNMRGVFVEAILLSPQAAEKEVLHVGRPPLFF